MKNNKNNCLIFCNNLKHIRNTLGLTQKQMADLCGTSVYMLRKIENNILPKHLSVDILFHIHRSFNIPPSQLFEPINHNFHFHVNSKNLL